jgi:hypothetical protein
MKTNKIKEEIVHNWDYYIYVEQLQHNPSLVLNVIDKIFGDKLT